MNNQKLKECLKKVLHSFHSRHADFLKDFDFMTLTFGPRSLGTTNFLLSLRIMCGL